MLVLRMLLMILMGQVRMRGAGLDTTRLRTDGIDALIA